MFRRLMKRGVAAVLPVLAMLLCQPLAAGAAPGTTVPQVDAATPRPVIIFSPHQDDELISMGEAILAHKRLGRPVYVVFAGNGQGTSARGVICQQKGICLTAEQVGVAREKEATAALGALGVPPEMIAFERIPETEVTLRVAHLILDKYIAKFGTDATYITMSWFDASADHYNLGYALNSRCTPHWNQNQSVIRPAQLPDCRFYQSPVYRPGNEAYFPIQPKLAIEGGGIYKAQTAAEQQQILNAVAEYRLWDPAIGRFGIANYSVPTQLYYVTKLQGSKYHLPSTALTDPMYTQGYVNFILQYQFDQTQAKDSSVTSLDQSTPNWPIQPPAPTPGVLNITISIPPTPAVDQVIRPTFTGMPSSGVEVAYHWLRDGVEIPGQVYSAYTISTADVGHRVSLQISAWGSGGSGYQPGEFTSNQTEVISATVPLKPLSIRVTLPGAPVVGQVIRPTFYGMPSGVQVAYQWLRDGSPITGQKYSAYTVSTADRGHRISLKISVWGNGYQPGEFYSGMTLPSP